VQGVNHLYQLLRKQEDDLLDAKDRFLELKGKVAEKEEALRKELAEEKKLMAEEAQESATMSVIEAMYEMAKEASAAGFSLPSWDIKEWARMLGKPDEVEELTEERAGKGVVQETGASGSGGVGATQVGDESGMNA
jgi:hypothetical protein